MKRLTLLVFAALSCGVLSSQAAGPLQRAMEKRRGVDANKDGDISSNEIEKAWAAGKDNRKASFKEFDTNGDGVLVKSEFNNEAAFKKTDLNGDGKITENEYLGTIAGKTRKALDKADSNDDGVISDAERSKRIKDRIDQRK